MAGRILLADDSAIAQRIGEKMLREEGFEVVSVTDGETALLRLADVHPDAIIADAYLPRKSGFELTEYIRSSSQYRHIGVLLTGSITEPVDEPRAQSCGSDGVVQKPFDATSLMGILHPLLTQVWDRRPAESRNGATPPARPVPVTEEERVRAAVTVALDIAMPQMVDHITREVLRVLRQA